MTDIEPPVAKKVPYIHNYALAPGPLPDDYHWMKDQTPGANKRQEIIDYLKEENAYAETVHLKPNAALIDTLYNEFLSRIQEDDAEVPFFKAPYWYYTKTVKGLQYKIHCRRLETMDAPEEAYLDPNELKHEYVDIGKATVSPDHSKLAYSLDTKGDEKYGIFLKDLATGDVSGPLVEDVAGSIVWDGKNKAIYYNVMDEIQRSYAIKRHVLGTQASEDTFVYTEDDKKFMVYAFKTQSNRFLVIQTSSSLTSECRYVDLNDETPVCKLFHPREHRHKYDIDHQGDRFLILTDGGGQFLNNKLQECPLDKTGKEHWRDIIPYDPYRHIETIVPFRSHIVLLERSTGLRRLRVVTTTTPVTTHLLDFTEPVFDTDLEAMASQSYDANVLRFNYASLLTSRQVWEYRLDSRDRTLLKQVEVPGGFDPSKYTLRRMYADILEEHVVDAPFGTPVPKQIPVTVLYRTELFKGDGSNPGLLYGYGSYGICRDPRFDSKMFSYVDRGFVYMIAHIRGGGENGRGWYETGKFLNKKNTFQDFVTAADFVVEQKLVDRNKLAIEGRSAGGLLIGAVVNARPDLCKLAVAGVPFVDVINTMMDATIPLTVNEYEEWGNPNEKEYFDYMLSYSPYENVRKGETYPNLLVLAGLTDPRVQYWEPSKWVAKLREYGADRDASGKRVHKIVFNCKMGSGHFGASGRYGYLKEVAADYAFVISTLLGQ
ncbi:hypothetical protein HDU96_004717 [Phlyctochytrium bullatum]|nr:hypothetical protein HDU96_004717 [Phlyctochytrium bullatum]